MKQSVRHKQIWKKSQERRQLNESAEYHGVTDVLLEKGDFQPALLAAVKLHLCGDRYIYI